MKKNKIKKNKKLIQSFKNKKKTKNKNQPKHEKRNIWALTKKRRRRKPPKKQEPKGPKRP